MKITNRISKVLKLLATGSLSLLLSACYGPQFRSLAYTVTNEDDDPVPELRVSLVDSGSNTIDMTSTDSEGFFELLDFDNYTGTESRLIIIEDTDGPANQGEFETREIDPDDYADDTIVVYEEQDQN
ncbi:MAG: hypothetical protein JW874_02830 [Spirochaetales bacterium]|nr:hypothetical protein [Spirochaetales bacterium]